MRAGARYGSYILERLLHQGSRFDYWLAHGEANEIVVAALLHPHLLETEDYELLRERFDDRRSIRHPCIPLLVETVAANTVAAIFEHVPGVLLRTLCDRAGPFPEALAGRVVERIARAIHHARISPRWCSSNGIEPGNILIDPAGAPHLLLSPMIETPANVTGPGFVSGAIAYLSPEGIGGLPLCPQSIVFSLGVLLYELIAGRHPFRGGGSLVETLHAIHDGHHDPLEIATRDMQSIVERAMGRAPEDRQLHAGDLADELQRLLPENGERDLRAFAVRWAEELHDPEFEQRDTVRVEPATASDDASLLAAIAADRDSIEPYLVYADWLQSRGDPRGELIVLHHQQHPAAEQFLQEHPKLLGDLVPLLGQRGARAKSFEAGPHFIGDLSWGPVGLEWHLGFVKSIRLARGAELTGAPRVATVLRLLESNESTRFLRGLTIGPMDDDAYHTLASSRLALDSLFVGDLSQDELRCVHRSTASISAAFPALKRLAVRGSFIHLGRLILPELRELRLFSAGLTADAINAVASSAIPKLEHLELWFGGPPSRTAWPDRTSVLFEDRHLPNLKSLAIADREPNAVIGLIAALAESDLAKRLERLDLRESAIAENTLQAVLQDKARFPKLVEVLYSSSQKGRSGPTSSTG